MVLPDNVQVGVQLPATYVTEDGMLVAELDTGRR